MYVRATTRKNKDGSTVRYLQLAHNEWDAATGTSRPQVLHSFGREDQLDRAAVERLVASLAKLLDPAAALRATSGSELTFLASRPMGGTTWSGTRAGCTCRCWPRRPACPVSSAT